MTPYLRDTADLLAYRLERLSADSRWAHRASGIKGALLRCLQSDELDPSHSNAAQLEDLIARGFDLLTKAAREIPDPTRGQ